jgi:antitoxin ParD1/3/4
MNQSNNKSMTMNISLPKELQNFVDGKVETGRYTSASEVVREGLRLLEEQEELKKVRMDELERKLLVGVGQLNMNEGKPVSKIKALLRRSNLKLKQ